MMRRIVFLFTLFLCLKDTVVAEGSRELSANGGYRAFLLSQTFPNLSFPFPTLGTMKVYVKAGETIYAGSSAQGFGSGKINFRSPDGATYTSGTSPTVGLIADRGQEVAGPLPNAGGYTPYTRTVLPGQDGVWEIDFISESNGASSVGNPVPVLASANWTQAAGQYIAAFDISVRNAGNTAFIPGRVFTNIFSGILGSFDVGFNAIFRILTKDGYQYTLDNNSQAGNGFSFFANNKGFRTAAGSAAYLSVDDLGNPNIQDPRNADTGSDITHKIFFNTPAADLPASAPVPGGGTTWLLSAPSAATLGNITFTGAEGSNGVAGTFPLGANIGFTSNKNGTYLLSIDVNNNGSFTDAIDRKLTGSGVAGQNSVFWDGLDGLGNKVRSTTAGILTVNVSVVLFGGEVHFPFFDVERNVNGIILTRINGTGSPDNTVYWDDTPITLITGTPSNPLKNSGGLNSTVNGHKWGSSGAGPVDFGDENGIDTWGYIAGTPLLSTTSFQLREADLEVSTVTNSQNCNANLVTYVATVKNNGPDEVNGAGFSFFYPASISGITATTAVVSGVATASAGTVTAGKYGVLLNMKNGAVVRITLTGKVSLPVKTPLTVSAAIIRPADLTDPDATSPDAAPPADPLIECNAAPSGTGCNNIKELATVFLTPPDAGPDQVINVNKLAILTANSDGVWVQLGSLPLPAAIADPRKASTRVGGFKTAGKYEFSFTNANGCTDTVAVIVVEGAADTRVPNVFTPNGDGKNDVFEIPGISGFPGSQFMVFNRWGNEVYHSENYKNDWDGGSLAEGTYYYVFNRKESTGTYTAFKGWIYLKRKL